MSCTCTIEGTITQPTIHHTQNGTAICNLSIACTPRRKNQTTGQWENDGADLWITATFWNEEAEHYADTLHKGERILATGVLAREQYTRNDGTPGERLTLKHPKIAVKPTTHTQRQSNSVNTGNPPF